MTAILDLPENIFSSIIALLKYDQKLGPLRLVCRYFNYVVCESMFETIVVYSSLCGPSNDPVKWATTSEGLKMTNKECTRLIHLLNTLYTKRLPAALRRARHLKICVCDLFRLSKSMSSSGGQTLWQRDVDVQRVVQHLMLTFPTIIRTLGNLEETTLYLSVHDPDDFTRNISEALLTLPQLSTLNVNFSDRKASRTLPIVRSQRLKTTKISWPIGEPDPVSFLGAEQSSVYSEVVGAGAQATNLRRLEICARYRPSVDTGLYSFTPIPQLEELVLESVPISLDGETVKAMTRLRSLRLGGFDCSNCDPYAGVWTSLKLAGRKLRIVGVDVVGQALVDYLDSYAGLEALVFKLDKNANDHCVKELCSRSLRHHNESLKLLHVDIDPNSDFRITWFFEYWSQWIPAFSNLRILKVTTSMNLHSEFDSGLLVKRVADIVARIPTLSKLTIGHIHEDDPKIGEAVLASLLEGHSTPMDKPLPVAPSCLLVIQNFSSLFRVVLQSGEGLYGSLKFVSCGK